MTEHLANTDLVALPEVWIVWCEDGGSPTCAHRTISSAKSEAERLARGNPGKKFWVARCHGRVRALDTQWEQVGEAIPF